MDNNLASTEAELVRRIGEGDQDAECEFFTTYYSYVRGAAARRVAHQDADDLAQLVMWAACYSLRRKKFENRSLLKPWLAAIVSKKAMQYYREKLRHPTADADLSRESRPARQDLQVMLDEAISLLPSKHRLVFTKHEEGLTIEQISLLTCIPRGTIGRVLVEARLKLRRILGGKRRF